MAWSDGDDAAECRCRRCLRIAAKLDRVYGQCVRCNERDLRIAGLRTLRDSFDKDDPQRLTFVRQLRAMRPDDGDDSEA